MTLGQNTLLLAHLPTAAFTDPAVFLFQGSRQAVSHKKARLYSAVLGHRADEVLSQELLVIDSIKKVKVLIFTIKPEERQCE